MSEPAAAAACSEPVPAVTVLDVRRHAMKNYSYLVVDPLSRRAVIVDPAWQIEKVEAALVSAEATLDGILVTHSHHDHVHLSRPLSEKHGCPIWMSDVEIDTSGFRAPRLRGIGAGAWQVGRMRIEAILTPGHTPGSACYAIGANLFTGDVLFAEGCGICPDTAAAYEMFASLARLRACVAPRTRIFPGHSYGQQPGRPMAQLLRENIYLQFSDKESFASFRMRGGQDLAKLFVFS